MRRENEALLSGETGSLFFIEDVLRFLEKLNFAGVDAEPTGI
jgi:hypothetical protein